jgi:hypothetical protein
MRPVFKFRMIFCMGRVGKISRIDNVPCLILNESLLQINLQLPPGIIIHGRTWLFDEPTR